MGKGGKGRPIGDQPKVDKELCLKMRSEGKTQKECAEYFGVSASAINNIDRRNKFKVVGKAQMENATDIVKSEIGTIEQAQKINKSAIELLDAAMKALRDKDGNIKVEKALSPQLAVRAIAEIRNQMELQLKIYEHLTNARAMADFQQVVVEEIGRESSEVKNRIIDRLSSSRRLQQAVGKSWMR